MSVFPPVPVTSPSPGSNEERPALNRRPTWPRGGPAYAAAIATPLLTLGARLAMGYERGDAPMIILFIIPTIVAAYLGGLGPGLVATVVSGLLTDYFLLMPRGGTPIVTSLKSTQWLALLVVGGL